MTESPGNHPTAEVLRALSLGQLTEAELTPVLAHLGDCPACCHHIDQLAGDDRLLARLQQRAARREDALVSPALRRSAVLALRRSHEARSATQTEGAEAVPVNRPAPRQVGDYDVLAEVGRGGMGVVYKARHRGLHRPAALKMVLAGEFASPTQELRFRLEAELAARVRHPNIVQVYEVGTHDGRPFLAMEWVEGGSLANRLDGKPWPPGEAASLIETLARAIDGAHSQGVVHRDLKPANILLATETQRHSENTGETTSEPDSSSHPGPSSRCLGAVPKIADFGLAQTLEGGQTMTQSGFLVGTPGYMAPEQASGRRALVGPATDVYALGVVLYQLLTGQLPFRGDSTLEVLRAVASDEPVRPRRLQPRLPRDLEAVTLHCLEKEPARRYPTALALAEDLRRFREVRQVVARPVGSLARLARACRRRPHVALLLVLLAASVLGGLAGVTWKWLEANEQRDRANEQRDRADAQARQASDEKEAALHQAYRARLAAAGAALQGHDVADAARQLADAPEDLRGWEWRHLHSRLDDSSAVFPSPGRSFLWPHTATLRREVILGRTLQLLDEQGRIERSTPLAHPEEGPGDVAWTCTPEGVFIADEVAEGVVRLRHGTGEEWGRIRAPARARPNLFAISPDRKWAAVNWSTPAGWSLRGYDPSGAERVHFADLHTRSLWSLAFSPDGTLLASASDDGTGGLWEVATGRAIGGALRHPGKRRLRSATFRADAARLVTTSGDGTVCQWDARTGAAVEPPYERHAGEVWIAVYSPDGQWVASAGTDRTIRLWQATGRQEALVLRGHTGKVTQLAFAGDGHRLQSVSDDGTARVWDVDPRAPLPALRDHTDNVYAVAYSPDGRWIASGSWDRTLRLWDARTGHLCATLPHPGFVRALAFGPDGSWLVSGCDTADRLRIWDVATGQLRREVRGPGTIPQTLAVDPAGTRIAAADRDGSVRVLEAATGRVVASLHMNAGFERRELAYSSDGRWLAGTGEGNKVYLWDAETNVLVSALAGHAGEVYSVAFSPDGRLLASASQDRTVRVWDVATATCRAVLGGHTDEVFTAVFHPGGRRLASAGRDRAVWLWDLAAPGGQELVARLQGHSNYVFSLAFSPDGESLASASGDTTVRVWDAEPLRVRHEARRATEAARPEGEQLVARLLAELRDPARVVTRLRDDGKLSAPLRRAAMQALMRRGEQARP